MILVKTFKPKIYHIERQNQICEKPQEQINKIQMSLGSTVGRGAKSIPAERGSMKDLRHINILDHIAVGHENARTGVELAKILDINERDVRELVSVARYDTIILNLQDGAGYFFPDETENALIEKWLNQEEDRLKSHASSLHAARKWRKEFQV